MVEITDLFIYINIVVCMLIVARVDLLIQLSSATGTVKVLSIYIVLLVLMYIFANVLFLIYKPSIVYLSNLRPVYDCITLSIFSLVIKHLLRKAE